jgi:hypothetical protein
VQTVKTNISLKIPCVIFFYPFYFFAFYPSSSLCRLTTNLHRPTYRPTACRSNLHRPGSLLGHHPFMVSPTATTYSSGFT